MRTGDVDILIVPGYGGNDDDHWQSRWARNLRTARLVEQDDWCAPEVEAWCQRLVEEVARSTRPAVLVGHSLGIATIVHAAPRLDRAKVAGAFLVGPSDLSRCETWPQRDGVDWPAVVTTFQPLPEQPLPFPARLIGSSTDPFCSIERAQALGAAWGADVSVMGDAGHINSESGHGPWPDGLLTFGLFLKQLG